jgi:hypothetical protein
MLVQHCMTCVTMPSIVTCIRLGIHLVEAVELPRVCQAILYSHVVSINYFAPTHEAWSCGDRLFRYFQVVEVAS